MRINLKYIQLIFVASSFFYLSCQPEGGTLVPILQDGARITFSENQKDAALQYETESLSMKMSGGWESLYGNAGFTLIIKNKSPNRLKVNLDKVLLENTLRENLILVRFEEINPKTEQLIENNFTEIRVAEIKNNETKVFFISIGEKQRTYKGYDKCFGNEISITIPINIEQNKTSATTEYTFKFKYLEHLPETEDRNYSID
jgi:hypothetical protein